jgi:hypothetical protein
MRKLYGKPPRMGQNEGYKWNHSKGQAHLTNSKESAREFNILEIRGSIKRRLNV